MTIPCEDLEIWIERFRDGDLSGRELREARRHLAACSSCRERHEELEEIGTTLREALSAARPSIPPGDLIRLISQRIDAREATLGAEMGGQRPVGAGSIASPRARVFSLPLRPYGLALAAAVAGFVVVMSLLWVDHRFTAPWTASVPEEAPVRVEIQGGGTAPSAPVRLVDGNDPEWQVVWIGSEEPHR